MTIDFNCPYCRAPIHAPNDAGGMAGTCLTCKKRVQVPRTSKTGQNDQPHSQSLPSQLKQKHSKVNSKSSSRRKVTKEVSEGIAVVCPQCQQRFRVLEANAGKRFKCVYCSASITLPGASPLTLPAPSSQQNVVSPTIPANSGSGQRSLSPALPQQNRSWHVETQMGEQFGPIYKSTLEEWINDGRLSSDCYVWCEGWQDWRSITDTFPHSFRHAAPSFQQVPSPSQPYQANPVTIVNQSDNRGEVLALSRKSVGIAVVLGLFFGPLGMFYSTILGGIIMFPICVVLFLLGFLTFGVAWIFYTLAWGVCVLWAALAAESHNKRLVSRHQYQRYR